MGCGGGFQEQKRRILRTIRGNGACPKDTSHFRFRKKKCNVHDCNGDEICIAKQDLIIAIDGSGSMQEASFKVLKNFAATLVSKYQGEYYGAEAMKVGVVQFGNGEITDA